MHSTVSRGGPILGNWENDRFRVNALVADVRFGSKADIVECLRVVRFSPQGRTLSGRDQPIADIVSFIRLSLVNSGKHCSLVE